MSRQRKRFRWWMTNVRIAATLATVSAALHLLGLRRALILLDRVFPLGKAGIPAGERRARSVTLARRIAAVAYRMPRTPRCLSRSLALRLALRRRGIDSQLRIGVRRTGGFEAHAWVEVDGVPAGQPEDLGTQYAAFATIEV